MPDLTMKELQAECHQIAQTKGWWKNPRPIPEVLMLMVTELSEAMEEWRESHEPTEIYFRDDGKPEGFPIELADCVIRILDVTKGFGIDLQAAVETKMAYNRSRPYRHGGKRA